MSGTPQAQSSRVLVPVRVDTFLCHHDYFVQPPRPQVYPVNSINFGLERYTEAEVFLRDDGEVVIDSFQKNPLLIRHVVKIMQKTLGIDYGFNVRVHNQFSDTHGGYGSVAGMTIAVAQAINLMMGDVLSPQDMTKLLAQNFGEETEKSDLLSTTASIGGAAAVGLSRESLVIVGGEAEIWYAGQLSKLYNALVLYPKNMRSIAGVTNLKLDKKDFSLFEHLGSEWGNIKESILKERILPTLQKNDFSELFRAINMYSLGAYGDIPQYFRSHWLSHNIFFDRFIHTLFSRLFNTLSIEENCFFVSSGGPLIVIISNNTNKALESLGDFRDHFFVTEVQLVRQ